MKSQGNMETITAYSSWRSPFSNSSFRASVRQALKTSASFFMIKLQHMLNSLQIPVRQFWWAMAISAITVFLTFVPLIYGQVNSGDKFFTGKSVTSRYDLPTYLSWIQQGRE